jgi:hypothetical protein
MLLHSSRMRETLHHSHRMQGPGRLVMPTIVGVSHGVAIPPAVWARGFTVATALSNGVTPARLRSADLATPFWGTRIGVEAPQGLADRARVLLDRLGPPGLRQPSQRSRVVGPAASNPQDARRRQRPEADALPARRRYPWAQYRYRAVQHSDARRSPDHLPARTWIDLAAIGFGVEGLIVAGDRIVTARRQVFASVRPSSTDCTRPSGRSYARWSRGWHPAVSIAAR